MALERRETVAALAEPRVVATRERILVAGEVGADVVEHAVEQDPQATPAGLGDQVVEVGVVTEARVDPVVVGGVVAVGRATRTPGRARYPDAPSSRA